MGVKIEWLFHKDMPFPTMISKIVDSYLDLPAGEALRVPLPFLQRLLETNSLTVIHLAIEDYRDAIDFPDLPKLDSADEADLVRIEKSDKLDEIDEIVRGMIKRLNEYIDEQAESSVKVNPSQAFRKHVFSGNPPTFSFRTVDAAKNDPAVVARMQEMLDAREPVKKLLMQKEEPSSPMDVAAAKVLKEHQEAGTLDSTSDEELGRQVQDQYFKDWETSLEPQDAAAWDRASPLHIEHVSLRDTIKRMLQLRGLDGYLQNDGSIVLTTGEVKTFDELRQMPVTEPVGQMLTPDGSVLKSDPSKKS